MAVADRVAVMRDGRILQAAPPDAAPGAVFLVRPDGLALTAPAAATLTGRVTRATYLGDRTRLIIEGAGDGPLAVDVGRDYAPAPETAVGLEARPGAILATAPAPQDQEATA
jgi:ABC-type Fe3+/spermidine/putrescine transport system ATPase subunit